MSGSEMSILFAYVAFTWTSNSPSPFVCLLGVCERRRFVDGCQALASRSGGRVPSIAQCTRASLSIHACFASLSWCGGGLLGFGTTQAPTALACGPPSLWDHQGPRRMGVGASLALGAPRRPPHWPGVLRCFGTTEAPVAWVQGCFSLWDQRRLVALARGPPWRLDHRGPCPMDTGPSFTLGPPRAPPQGRAGLLRLGIIEAPVACARGPLSVWDY